MGARDFGPRGYAGGYGADALVAHDDLVKLVIFELDPHSQLALAVTVAAHDDSVLDLKIAHVFGVADQFTERTEVGTGYAFIAHVSRARP